MAWRPHGQLIEGELDNTTPGRVPGWLRFLGLAESVKLDLEGDFHRDIRGARIRLKNPAPREREKEYMEGICTEQTGKVGDITAGLPPCDYGNSPYVEWYAENGRVVLELSPEQVEIIGTPRPWREEEPISRETQNENLRNFVQGLSESLGVPAVIFFGGGDDLP